MMGTPPVRVMVGVALLLRLSAGCQCMRLLCPGPTGPICCGCGGTLLRMPWKISRIRIPVLYALDAQLPVLKWYNKSDLKQKSGGRGNSWTIIDHQP